MNKGGDVISVEITAAWIGGGCTIVAAAIAFGTLAAQGHQNRKAEKKAREQAFNEALYTDGVAAARDLSNAAGSFTVQLFVAQQQVHMALLTHRATGAVQPPSIRYPEFMALDRAFSAALTDLIFLIEERRIADQRLEIFKLALLAKAHDVREAFGAEFQWHLLKALQHELPNGTLSPYTPPTEEEFELLVTGIGSITDPLSDCGAFCEDLIVELQNVHLGEVFKTKLAHRVPSDPSRVVLRLDDHESLAAWIETTSWEQNNKKVEARFAASLRGKSRGVCDGTDR